jgi:HEPN domain-containing protein
MYANLLSSFENIENLGGKAWEHAVNIDLIETTNIKNCSLHCFHYQQMFEMLFKHILETKSEFGAYPHSHKLHKLLEAVIATTEFKTDKRKYIKDLQVITVCAEEYRYNFLLDCKAYRENIEVCNNLLKELIEFNKQI